VVSAWHMGVNAEPRKTGPRCSDEELGAHGKGDASNGALTFYTHIVGSPCRGKQGLILHDTRTVRAVGASDEQGGRNPAQPWRKRDSDKRGTSA
jgi:hypothetical protein